MYQEASAQCSGPLIVFVRLASGSSSTLLTVPEGHGRDGHGRPSGLGDGWLVLDGLHGSE